MREVTKTRQSEINVLKDQNTKVTSYLNKAPNIIMKCL